MSSYETLVAKIGLCKPLKKKCKNFLAAPSISIILGVLVRIYLEFVFQSVHWNGKFYELSEFVCFLKYYIREKKCDF